MSDGGGVVGSCEETCAVGCVKFTFTFCLSSSLAWKNSRFVKPIGPASRLLGKTSTLVFRSLTVAL